MPYCTETDIIKALPEATLIALTDDAGIDAVDSDVVAEAISKADGEIDAYVVSRYATPLTAPIPAIIRALSVDIAIYLIYKRRLEEIPETRATSYKDAIRTLRDIRDGKMPLPVTLAESEAAESDFAFGAVISGHFGD